MPERFEDTDPHSEPSFASPTARPAKPRVVESAASTLAPFFFFFSVLTGSSGTTTSARLAAATSGTAALLELPFTSVFASALPRFLPFPAFSAAGAAATSVLASLARSLLSRGSLEEDGLAGIEATDSSSSSLGQRSSLACSSAASSSASSWISSSSSSSSLFSASALALVSASFLSLLRARRRALRSLSAAVRSFCFPFSASSSSSSLRSSS
mmetsp:Transcript_4179/g.4824  ORF Transcript_4179/g.4824 Transcript_4179/m.4824 type:complete len:213 (+) Transcript_4179:1172-1810(+)